MQKHVNLVDLVKSFPTNIYLQNLASIQKRTSPVKFAHLAEKSGKGSISNLSTKAEAETRPPRHARPRDPWRDLPLGRGERHTLKVRLAADPLATLWSSEELCKIYQHLGEIEYFLAIFCGFIFFTHLRQRGTPVTFGPFRGLALK